MSEKVKFFSKNTLIFSYIYPILFRVAYFFLGGHMKRVNITELEKIEFSEKIIGFSLQSYWKNGSVWNVLHRPRPAQAIIYAAGCSIDYTLDDGARVKVERGEALYIPRGLKYKATFSDVTLGRSTVLINFDLEASGENFNLAETPTLLPQTCVEELEVLYSRMSVSEVSSLEVRGRLLFLLSLWQADALRKNAKRGKRYSAVSRAVEMIERSENYNFPVRALAAACHLSESLFRKRFRECFGISPKDYCLNLRIEKAKRLMSFEGMSVNATCELLDFSSPSYFSRLFKEKTGVSPKKFAQSSSRREDRVF